MNRKNITAIFLILLAVIFVLAHPAQAKAAAYQTIFSDSGYLTKEERTVGSTEFRGSWSDSKMGYTLYFVTSAGKTKFATGADPMLISNGKTIYYVKKGYLYKCTTSKPTPATKIAKLDKGDDTANYLAGYYDGKIFFTRGIDPGTFCYVKVKDGKIKELDKNTTTAYQHDNLFVMMPYRGDVGPVPLRYYDAATGKKTTVAEKTLDYYANSKYIYYVKVVKNAYPMTVEVWRYTISSGAQKKLVSKFKCYGVNYISSKKLTYWYEDNSQATKTKKW